MLAASRKDKVIGRTRILNDSTRTKKGLSQSGAPPGRIPAVNVDGEFEKDDIMRASQIGRASLRVKYKWLEVENT